MKKHFIDYFQSETTRIKTLSFHPFLPVLVTGHHCGAIYIWDLHYKKIIKKIEENDGSVRAIKFHPLGNLFASAGDDRVIRIFDYKSKKLTQTLKGHTDYIRSLDFHPIRPYILSGSDDCTIKIFNYNTGELLSSSVGHHHYVMSAKFIDSVHIISGSLDHNLALWNCSSLFEDKKKILTPSLICYQNIDAHERGVNFIYIKNDLIFTGSDDRDIKTWKFADEHLQWEDLITSHDSNVTGLYVKDEKQGFSLFGVGEDGNLTLNYKNSNSVKSYNTRLWCVDGTDDFIAVGGDNNLFVLKYKGLLFSDSSFYAKNNKIFNLKNEFVLNCKNQFLAFYSIKDSFLFQYKENYLIYKNSSFSSSYPGLGIFYKEKVFSVNNNSLFCEDKVLLENLNIENLYSTHRYLVLKEKQRLVFYDNEKFSFLNFNLKINKVLSLNKLIFILCDFKIFVLNENLKIIKKIEESVNLCDFYVIETHKLLGLNSEEIKYDEISSVCIFYSTLLNLKYYFQGVGLICSIFECNKIMSITKSEMLYLNNTKILKKTVNLDEIKFRNSVYANNEILKTIETLKLPGLSPIDYLIKKEKASIAIPFIKDPLKKFNLYLSDKNYKECYKLCNSYKMYNELAFKIINDKEIDTENLKIAENCFKKNKDNKNLFYLFLFSKQFEKLQTLETDEIKNMVKIITEDKTILTNKE